MLQRNMNMLASCSGQVNNLPTTIWRRMKGLAQSLHPQLHKDRPVIAKSQTDLISLTYRIVMTEPANLVT